MGGGRKPGPLDQLREWLSVLDGTMARVASPTPGPIGSSSEPSSGQASMNLNRRRRRDDASADVADRPIDGTPDYVERVKAVLPHLNRASHVDAHFKSRRHAGTQIARIVIHDTGSGNRSTFRDSQRYLAHPQDGRDVSIHYLIGREEGEFVSMVPEDMVANHAHGNNRDTIGIELFRRGNETRDFSDWQYETVAQLIFDLRFRYAIGRNGVIGHGEIEPKKRGEPHGFDWARLDDLVEALAKKAAAFDSLFMLPVP